MIRYFRHNTDFKLEGGKQFDTVQIAYHTFGTFKPGVKVIWVCHALTANSDVSEWWSGLFGKDLTLDPEKYFIVCANNLGSCYGTSFEPPVRNTTELPLITTRDISQAHLLLMNHLQINQIHLLIGGSQGGQIALEIAYARLHSIEKMVLLATNARHSSWGIAFNEAQRLAIASNAEDGLKAARAIAMLSYRNYEMYSRTANEDDYDKIEEFGAATYQRHQAEKLKKRFDAASYWMLSRAMDSHNLGRGRGDLASVLGRIQIPTLLIGISSDILFPISELQFLEKHLPNARLKVIDSAYGHDGFLTETRKINHIIQAFVPIK